MEIGQVLDALGAASLAVAAVATAYLLVQATVFCWKSIMRRML